VKEFPYTTIPKYSHNVYKHILGEIQLMRNRSRKGSLEISITAVVVLIIAIVMLGLGLGFIRQFFGGTVKQLGAITETLDEQTRTELLASSTQITFLSRRIKVEGREKEIPFAIRNIRPNEIEFGINTRCFDAIGTDAIRQSAESFVNFETFQSQTIEGGKSDVFPLKIILDAAASPTIYKCEMTIDILNEIAPDGSQIQPATDAEKRYARQLFEVDYKK